ncbi:hypothetical protein CYMTET_8322 [Cymbomonas tetramitiformis]|uniref:Uncharacterized protein n=1 Tax=Cymbomonas tetramitiformis TaxID=36881 RepID=A0AAE0GTU8_9CHLO|nr:hypothetical protein CYMTET_8322 [Cymbomonas tetramitiformis]
MAFGLLTSHCLHAFSGAWALDSPVRQASVVPRGAGCPLPVRGRRQCPHRTTGDRKGTMPRSTTLASGLGIPDHRTYPQVVVPFLGPWGTFLGPEWDGAPPSPPCSPPPSEHEPEEVVQPALNGNQHSARAGLYVGGGYGIDLAAPLHPAGAGNIADIFTQPLPPRDAFYTNPSYYGLEIHSEVSDADPGYGSAMDEVD